MAGGYFLADFLNEGIWAPTGRVRRAIGFFMGDGLFNKFKMLIGVEDAEEEEIQVVSAPASAAPAAPAAVGDIRRTQAVYMNRSNTFVQPKMEHRDNKVVSMQNTGKKQFKLVVTDPKSFDECPKLVDNLKSKKPVILNLEKLENETARKIFDFLSGATYALDGNVQKIANNIFVFAPENVDVMAGIEQGRANIPLGESSPWRK